MLPEFSLTRRVQFSETDMAGIMHFSNFFKMMEEVEHAFFRSVGLSVSAILQDAIRDAREAQTLDVTEGRVAWTWRDSLALALPFHLLSLAVQDFFAPGESSLVKRCAATDCGGLFLDTSRTHRRRWCTMASCGNRDKVRRYRASHEP